MSGASPPPAKPSRRQRILTHLTLQDDASSSPTPPYSLSSQAGASSTARVATPSSTQAASSSTAPAGLVFAESSTAGTDPLTSPRATSNAASGSNLLRDVLKRLSEDDRATLHNYISHDTSDVGLGLEQALAAAKEKQRYCIEKRWTFTVKGRTIAVKEKADKVVGWLNRFAAVGDVVANVDPVHVGLPWAGIRLLLEAAVSEANQMTSLLGGCEIALYMANRLRAYIEFLYQVPSMPTRTNLETAVMELYAHVLCFLARAIRTYQMPTPHRALRAFWTKGDIVDFEKASNELGIRVEIEASNCDRALRVQDQELSGQLRQDLQEALGKFEQFHLLQGSLDRLETKIDLDKLPYAKGAMYDSYGDDLIFCHPDTRVDLLRDIDDWAEDPCSKSIFWLSGWAGIGKSTISRTVAQRLAAQGGRDGVDLGASFFFKRGEGDRASASRFFPTIARGLVVRLPELGALVAEAIAQDPSISDKALGEQFDKLIHRPLRQVDAAANGCSTFVVVVDALDECEKERDIRAIIDLWSMLVHSTNVRLKLFLTSRPELPVQLGFRNIATTVYQDMVLQDVIPQKTVQHDILIFLQDAFGKIRDSYNLDPFSEGSLDQDWPGDGTLQALVDMAVPLFIVAATVCRLVGHPEEDPREKLENFLQSPSFGKSKSISQTYLSVLTQWSARASTSDDKDELHQQFRTIVGSIVLLAEPLSRQSLADLLNIPPGTVARRLQSLHSVLRIPVDSEIPIRTLHLSFNEFLQSDQLQSEPFGVNSQATHRMLLSQSLRLLSGPRGLQENLCKLEYPGQPRQEIEPATINDRLSPAVQYACQYWIHHAQHGKVEIHDQDDVHLFLQRHFLHWIEAMSLINRLAQVISQIHTLQSLTSSNNSSRLSDFLEDARRIVLANRHFVELAPLQIYSSAMIFAPQTSAVRNICGRLPSWIRRYPITPQTWSLELQKLEGHTNRVSSVAFSQDGSLLASASYDQTVRLWNPVTGQEVQKLKGHTDAITIVAFSQDSTLASASYDRTVRLWNLTTGQEMQKLEHSDPVTTIAFSQDGSFLASASYDIPTIRLWNLTTGQEVQKFEGHTEEIFQVSFSQDGSLASASKDQSVRLWNLITGQEIQKLEYSGPVTSTVFSQDGLLLALANNNIPIIRIWSLITGQEVQKLEGYTEGNSQVVFSQDGSLLASRENYTLSLGLWDLSTGQQVEKLKGHTDLVNAIVFSQDGSLLASASDDITIRLWNTTTDQKVQKFEGFTDTVALVVFSQDGSLLASVLWNDGSVKIWNPATGQEIHKFEGHTNGTINEATVVAFSQDGSLLASASYDCIIRLWDLATGQKIRNLEGHTKEVAILIFSQDSSLLASASYDQTVRLWNPITGQEVQKLEGHSTRTPAIALSQDSSLLASTSVEDDNIRLWNPITGQEVQKLEGHTRWTYAIAFSQDGSLLATSSNDQTLRLWNLMTGQEVQKLENMGFIDTLDFTNNDENLLSNRGIIKIKKESMMTSTLDLSSNQTLMIRDKWIRRGDRNLLWLPQEYRDNCVAFRNNTFAFGLGSGQTSILQFDY